MADRGLFSDFSALVRHRARRDVARAGWLGQQQVGHGLCDRSPNQRSPCTFAFSPRAYVAALQAKRARGDRMTSTENRILRAEAAQMNGHENLALFGVAVVSWPGGVQFLRGTGADRIVSCLVAAGWKHGPLADCHAQQAERGLHALAYHLQYPLHPHLGSRGQLCAYRSIPCRAFGHLLPHH